MPSSDDDSDSSDMNQSEDDLPFIDLTKSSSVESPHTGSESATTNTSSAKKPPAKLTSAKPPPAEPAPAEPSSARTVPTPSTDPTLSHQNVC